VRLIEWWSRISHSGTIGDPTLATKSKGKLWYDATVAAIAEFIQEFRSFPVRPILDMHHSKPGPGPRHPGTFDPPTAGESMGEPR
jgi:hypothetical protein